MKTTELYCSLDIETTGFDPLTCEVLEVGFVFFALGDKGLKITEEWTQVFKPSKPVPHQILGLTGISQTELENAPTFLEHREFLQEKLGKAIIVGHNISFDTKFLEGFGLKFSGKAIDTLDLVQWLLPTHHSYNLENLMHAFGISHKEAHRALADSKATLKLLEKLLMVFCGLPPDLQKKIKKLIAPFGFFWTEFLDLPLQPLNFKQQTQAHGAEQVSPLATGEKIDFKAEAFYNFSLSQNLPRKIALANKAKNILLVVPRAQQSLELLKGKLVQGAEFLPENLFDEKKFNKFLKIKGLSAEEIKFALKILVWQATNWQTQAIIDLNLSFFGGQFKNLISGGTTKESKTAKVLVCDQQAFLYLAEKGFYRNRQAIICGLNEFESTVTSGISTRVSWGYINYLLKSFYNPEQNLEEDKFKQPVQDGLLAGDLFFGLVGALLKNEGETFQYFKVTAQTEYDERWQKIKKSAESFLTKLEQVNSLLKSSPIEKFLTDLKTFFQPQDNRVKWLELAENRCQFSSMPLDISPLVKNILGSFSGISMADCLDKDILPEFFLKRLGVANYKIVNPDIQKKEKQGVQKDLFSNLKKAFGKNTSINYRCLEKASTPEEILSILKTGSPWPAAVLFSSPAQVKEFYEQNYEQLKPEVSLLAQTSYGGSNKIFRNFGISDNSLLLATDKFVLKGLGLSSAVEPVSSLKVKTLVICRLPFEQFTHPYQEALSSVLPNAFEDYSLPKALYNFHNLLKFFYTPSLREIYIIDAKLAKPYAKVFKDYWKNIPGSQIKA